MDAKKNAYLYARQKKRCSYRYPLSVLRKLRKSIRDTHLQRLRNVIDVRGVRGADISLAGTLRRLGHFLEANVELFAAGRRNGRIEAAIGAGRCSSSTAEQGGHLFLEVLRLAAGGERYVSATCYAHLLSIGFATLGTPRSTARHGPVGRRLGDLSRRSHRCRSPPMPVLVVRVCQSLRGHLGIEESKYRAFELFTPKFVPKKHTLTRFVCRKLYNKHKYRNGTKSGVPKKYTHCPANRPNPSRTLAPPVRSFCLTCCTAGLSNERMDGL